MRTKALVAACALLAASCTGTEDLTATTPATSRAATTAAVTSTSKSPAPAAPKTTSSFPARANEANAVPQVADDPATLADQLVAAELAVRRPGTPAADLIAASRTAQIAYRHIADRPAWDGTVNAKVPANLRPVVTANVTALRELAAIRYEPLKNTLPAWRIIAPAPEANLLGWYREAEQRYGTGWQYLAAINLIESSIGRISGPSAAGAQGPMQFLPSTWAEVSEGGDINDPHDAIMGAARYLARNGMSGRNVDGAIYRYNPTEHYVNAVKAVASVLTADIRSFAGYYRWDVYYRTTAGVALLPIGYAESQRIAAAAYLAEHPERLG